MAHRGFIVLAVLLVVIGLVLCFVLFTAAMEGLAALLSRPMVWPCVIGACIMLMILGFIIGSVSMFFTGAAVLFGLCLLVCG